MSLQFGTSGLRGLVSEMTDAACALYTTAFVRYLRGMNLPGAVVLAGDLRSSTPRILAAAATAIRTEGCEAVYCGAIPTPALTLYGMQQGLAGLMVTGSHIPDDRNGIKFTLPSGEILKEDERKITAIQARLRAEQGPKESAAIQARLRAEYPPAAAVPHANTGEAPGPAPITAFPSGNSGSRGPESGPDPSPPAHPGTPNPAAAQAYLKRYLDFFPPRALQRCKVVCYQHSSVIRELLPELLRRLGAEVHLVGRSESFVPVDTEAVENREELTGWVKDAGADALVSADGDGDRPLVVDEKGVVVRGDVLGILVAGFLGADSVSAPVSCNTALEKCGLFPHVSRTRIGSPYVIESMLRAVHEGYRNVVGYEANGGFLTATEIFSPDSGARLMALPTRDAALPILALLRMSVLREQSVSALASSLPARFTHSGLLRGFPGERGARLIRSFAEEGLESAKRLFGNAFGEAQTLDLTDGARMTFPSGDIVHLRPSGNAPEFRCYTEADSPSRAAAINRTALEIVRACSPEP